MSFGKRVSAIIDELVFAAAAELFGRHSNALRHLERARALLDELIAQHRREAA